MLGYIVVQVIIVIYLIIVGVITMHYSLKCIDIMHCHNKKCKCRNFCSRYKESITEEEAKELNEYIQKVNVDGFHNSR